MTETINVTAVNDPSVLAALEGAPLAYTENSPAATVTGTITVGDVDDTNIESATIQITGNYQNGQDVLAFTDIGPITGSWNAVTGTMTLSGTDSQANYQAALRTVTYQNTSDDPSTLTRTVSFTVDDGDDPSNTVTRNINVTAVNDVPVLTGTNNLSGINRNPVANPGTLVAELIAGHVTDPDAGALEGIAVTAVDNSNGAWQYSTNGGSIWNAFGAPSTAVASLLAADVNTYLRFVPNVNWSGTVAGGLTFQAWDRTSGAAGGTANTSPSGGMTPFSSASASAAVTVTASNTAPTLSGANNLAAISEDPVTNPGTLVSALIAGKTSDADPGALTGLAVTAVDNTNGTWQYSLNGGGTWTAFGAPSDAAARLLAADASTYVRFAPNADWNGTVNNGLTFHAWDQTSGVAGGTANITATQTVLDQFSAIAYNNNDGTSAWSTDWIDIDGNATGGSYRITGGELQIKTNQCDGLDLSRSQSPRCDRAPR